jgi:hypothetical protein
LIKEKKPPKQLPLKTRDSKASNSKVLVENFSLFKVFHNLSKTKIWFSKT